MIEIVWLNKYMKINYLLVQDEIQTSKRIIIKKLRKNVKY